MSTTTRVVAANSRNGIDSSVLAAARIPVQTVPAGPAKGNPTPVISAEAALSFVADIATGIVDAITGPHAIGEATAEAITRDLRRALSYAEHATAMLAPTPAAATASLPKPAPAAARVTTPAPAPAAPAPVPAPAAPNGMPAVGSTVEYDTAKHGTKTYTVMGHVLGLIGAMGWFLPADGRIPATAKPGDIVDYTTNAGKVKPMPVAYGLKLGDGKVSFGTTADKVRVIAAPAATPAPAAAPKTVAPAAPSSNGRCSGTTANSKPCGMIPASGESYCRHHKPAATPAPAAPLTVAGFAVKMSDGTYRDISKADLLALLCK